MCIQSLIMPGTEWTLRKCLLEEGRVRDDGGSESEKRRRSERKGRRSQKESRRREIKIKRGVSLFNKHLLSTDCIYANVRATVSAGQNNLWTIKQVTLEMNSTHEGVEGGEGRERRESWSKWQK